PVRGVGEPGVAPHVGDEHASVVRTGGSVLRHGAEPRASSGSDDQPPHCRHQPTETQMSVEMKLEVIVIPVSNVDRAKRFYEKLGWRLDADFLEGEDFRVVQLTPPASECSIIFGKGVSSAVPGSVQGLHLVVFDI